jgi:quercetin dioxygenase-like cupin family protein
MPGKTDKMITRRRMLVATGGVVAITAAPHVAPSRDALAQPNPPVIFKRGNETMQITRSGTQASAKGSSDYFTGAVRTDSRFQGTGAARVGGAFVTFEPGARTAWHTHPLGQTLIVTAGCGWIQVVGEPKEDIRPGDIVWIPAGEKHWHGATASTAVTHIAIAESLDGKAVDWLEKVSDEDYHRKSG